MTESEIVTGLAYKVFGDERQKSNAEPVSNDISVDEYYRHSYMLLTREQIEQLDLSGLPMLEEHTGPQVGSIIRHWLDGNDMYIQARVTDPRTIRKVRNRELPSLSVHYAVYQTANPVDLSNFIGNFNRAFWCKNTDESSILFNEISLTRDPFFKGCDLVMASGQTKARLFYSSAFTIISSVTESEKKKDQNMSNQPLSDDMIDDQLSTPQDKSNREGANTEVATTENLPSTSQNSSNQHAVNQGTVPTGSAPVSASGLTEESFKNLSDSDKWRLLNEVNVRLSNTLSENMLTRRNEFDSLVAPGLKNMKMSQSSIERIRNQYMRMDELNQDDRSFVDEMVTLGKNSSPKNEPTESSKIPNADNKRDSSHLNGQRPEEPTQKKTKPNQDAATTTDRLMSKIYEDAYKSANERYNQSSASSTPSLPADTSATFASPSENKSKGVPTEKQGSYENPSPRVPMNPDTTEGRMAIAASATRAFIGDKNVSNDKLRSLLGRYVALFESSPSSIDQESAIRYCGEFGNGRFHSNLF